MPRAWSLIGAYGAGKSTFGVFLHALLGGNDRAATEAARVLGKQSRGLATRFRRQKPWCRVVLDRQPRTVEPALAHRPPRRRKRVLARSARSQASSAERHPQRIYTTTGGGEPSASARRRAAERTGAYWRRWPPARYRRTRQVLEFEVRQRNGSMGSTYLLQELAERTYLGREANLMLFVLQHQTFDMYALGISEQLQNEWAKVQGRFQGSLLHRDHGANLARLVGCVRP